MPKPTHTKKSTSAQTTVQPSGRGRVACIHVQSLGLQHAMRTTDVPREHAHVLERKSTASARVLECNAVARASGITVGMRVHAARSLCPNLYVSTVEEAEVEAQRRELSEQLRTFSPWVERHPMWPDSFWLRGDGLSSLWANATQWGEAIHTFLALRGWSASIVVGFSRFFALAVARQYSDGARVFRDAAQERERALCASLHTLLPDPALQNDLEVLGVRTLADLHALPPGAVHRRYGSDAARWVQWVRAERRVTSHAVPVPETYAVRTEWDEAIRQKTALIQHLQEPIMDALTQVQRAGYSCESLHFTMHFDWGRYVDARLQKRAQRAGVAPHGQLSFVVRAAFAHVELARWTALLRLLLSKVHLPLGVVRVDIAAEPVQPEVRQEQWGDAGQMRRPDALLEALARVRAEFGDDVVGVLEVGETHLPETRHQWNTCTRLQAPAPHPRWTPTSIRRMLSRTRILTRCAPEDALYEWLTRPRVSNPCVRKEGPYVVAGAWWHTSVERAYYYAFMQRGDVLWVYYDRVRKRWLLQAEIF